MTAQEAALRLLISGFLMMSGGLMFVYLLYEIADAILKAEEENKDDSGHQ